MRVLMVSPQFRPIVGGYERAAERLAASLAARGHGVTVLAERRYPAWPKRESFDHVELRRWWCWYRPGVHVATSLLGLLWTLALRGWRFEVWHAHQYGHHAAVTVLMGKLLRRPVVLKLTSSCAGGIAQSLRGARFATILRFLHRRVDGVAAPTRETAREAVDFGIPSHRVRVVPNGVDVRRLMPTPRCERRRCKEALGVPDVPIAISIGRLVQPKQIDLMIQAWALAMAHVREPWMLVIVGEGQERASLEAQAMRLGLGQSVRFVGHQANIEAWLSCAELFLQSSSREGLSNTMLEAMAAGLPVVITAVSGTKECVGETGAGRVVPIGDTDALAAALVELASDPVARDRCGAVARRVVDEGFSVEGVVDRCEALYRDLIGGSKFLGGAGTFRPLQ